MANPGDLTENVRDYLGEVMDKATALQTPEGVMLSRALFYLYGNFDTTPFTEEARCVNLINDLMALSEQLASLPLPHNVSFFGPTSNVRNVPPSDRPELKIIKDCILNIIKIGQLTVSDKVQDFLSDPQQTFRSR